MTEAQYCVVDVETAVGDFAGSIAAGGSRPAIRRTALHELVGGSILTFRRDARGVFGGFAHVRLGAAGEDEAAMLRSADAAMRPIHAAGGVLATFNGAHDLAVLRRRAGRHWLFGLFDMERWPSLPGASHLDLMRADRASDGGRWPNLVDAAAGFGFDATCPHARASSATAAPAIRKAKWTWSRRRCCCSNTCPVRSGRLGRWRLRS